MNTSDPEKDFLEKVKGLLDEGADTLDSQTRQRLEHMRVQALGSAGEKRSGFFTPLRWVMVGGFATAAMAAVAFFFWVHTSPGVFPVGHIDDFDIITSDEHFDFYQDLDFYRWLAAIGNDATGEGATGPVTM
jgi:hypothetical protein